MRKAYFLPYLAPRVWYVISQIHCSLVYRRVDSGYHLLQYFPLLRVYKVGWTTAEMYVDDRQSVVRLTDSIATPVHVKRELVHINARGQV
jgi:hypothetical protein